ncbi:hypothetical protein PENSPDRAFT_95096 [Peniophora sp. CONT]|nr:hypothetical protein PENSPDRAFT_95096 [Peniophora sp. CONT]
MVLETTEVALRGPGDPLTRPPWAYPYYDEMELSAYFQVSGSYLEDFPSCEAYVRAQPLEAYRLLWGLYNQRRLCGTNYPLWLLTQVMADYFLYGIGEKPELHMSEETYNELVMGPGHLPQLCLLMVGLDNKAKFFEEHPTWIRGVLDLINGIMALHFVRHEDRLLEEMDSPTMNMIRKMGCTLWEPLWTNRWVFMDGNRQEEFWPGTGEELRLALSNLVFNYYRFFKACDMALKGKTKRVFNEFRDYGYEDLRRLALFCWMYRCRTKPGEPWPLKFEQLYHCTGFAFLSSRPDERLAFVQNDIVGTYGARVFLERAAETLRRTDLRGLGISNFLESLLLIVWDVPSFAPHLVKSGVLQAVSALFERQLPLENECDKVRLSQSITMFYAAIASKFPLAEGASPIVRQCNAMKFLSRTTMLAFNLNFPPIVVDSSSPITSSLRDSLLSDCLHVLNMFITIAEVIVKQSTIEGGTSGRKSGLHVALHDALKPVWLPTYTDFESGIRQAGKESARQTEMKEAWVRYGEIVGLNLERERAEVRRDARRRETCCAWKDCQWHRVPPPNPPRVCKGCGEVRYCSKTCQTDDWRAGHKKDCKRLK